MTPLRLLDLFSGIGGFSLGLERSGAFKTVAFCEIEKFPRRVLAKHWPEVPCFEDVRTLTAAALADRGIAVDAICGGFPCTDISVAGKGAGLEGMQSGLWFEYARIISELRPLLVIIENVPRLRTLGGDRVLSDLEELGYAGEPFVVGAVHAGAPHRRQRVWIVAHANGARLEGWFSESMRERPGEWSARESGPLADADCLAPVGSPIARAERNPWKSESSICRVADGVSFRVDRLRALGNAVVPEIPEIIGRGIARTLNARSTTSRGAEC